MKINPIMPRNIVKVGASKSPKGMLPSPVKGLSPNSKNALWGSSIATAISAPTSLLIVDSEIRRINDDYNERLSKFYRVLEEEGLKYQDIEDDYRDYLIQN